MNAPTRSSAWCFEPYASDPGSVRRHREEGMAADGAIAIGALLDEQIRRLRALCRASNGSGEPGPNGPLSAG